MNRRAAALLGSLSVAAIVFAGCIANPQSGDLGPNGFDPNTQTGPGPDGSTITYGPDGAIVTPPPPPPPTCAAGDLVTQAQCGGGLACDIDRTFVAPTSGDAGAPSDAATDGPHEGGGKGDGGKEGGGGGGGNGGGDGGGGGGGHASAPPMCRKATATGLEAIACNAADPTSCAVGLTCTQNGKDTAAEASCRKFCDTDTQCGAPGGACQAMALAGGAASAITSKACTLNCDAIAQTGCATGRACNLALTQDRSRLRTDCIHTGLGDHLATCVTSEDCKAGFGCLKLDDGLTVRHACLQPCVRPATAASCPAGRTCTQVPAPNTLAGKEYGWCF